MDQDNGRPLAIDAVLEHAAREPVPPDVVTRLRARLHESCRHQERSAMGALVTPPHPAAWRVRTFPAAALAASVLLAVALLPFGRRNAWAQVAEALQAKPWVRCTLQVAAGAPVPPGFQPPVMWLSARNKMGARQFMKAAQFVDLARQEARQYDPGAGTVSVLSLGADDKVDFDHLATLMRLVSEGKPALKPAGSPIELVGRARRDVSEGSRRWTEFTFNFRDPRRTPPDYTATLRVDPRTQLPIDMTTTEKLFTNDPAPSRTFVFDYPESGPADIYALGVPRNAAVVDRRRSEPHDLAAIKELFAAYDKARRKPMDPYSALVLVSDPVAAFSSIGRAFQVRYEDRNRHATEFDSERLLEFNKRIWSGEVRVPDGVDPGTWWQQQLVDMPFAPTPAGAEIAPDGVGNLNVGDGPPARNDPREFTLDRHPTSGPAGTILLRIRYDSGANFNEMAYWFDPEHDYMVVRQEMSFSRNPAESGGITTWVVDKVAMAPGGRWYATEARLGPIQKSGDDLSAERKPAPAVTTSVFRYIVNFKP